MFIRFKKFRILLLKKRVLFIFFILIVAILILFVISSFRSEKEITIGVITDIHAGSQNVRDDSIEEQNILHPSNFESNLKAALPKIKNFDFVITLGDNLNSNSDTKYIEKLKDLTRGYNMLWIRGNHDSPDNFSKLSAKKYYYVDKANWRIIILDNSESDPNIETSGNAYDQKGYIDPEQMNWLTNALKTEKKIVVAMHVPVFDRFNLDSAAIYPQQENLVKLFENSGNVKYVLSGHFHVYNWHRQISGINYYIVPSMSLQGKEGYYMTLVLPNP